MALTVEVWSDVVCPWCYVGKRRFEQALSEFEHRDGVEVVWRSFELDPRAPSERTGSYVERLASKYGVSIDEAQAMIDTMVETGERVGIEFRFDRLRAGNTFDAHRLLHWAKSFGLDVQGEVGERLFRATFVEGRPVGDVESLVSAAVAAGLDGAEARAVLSAPSAYAAEVRADEQEAAALGARGVPFFVFGRRLGVSGAQPTQVFLEVLERAWGEAAA